jgi:hypothetical protein
MMARDDSMARTIFVAKELMVVFETTIESYCSKYPIDLFSHNERTQKSLQ